MIALIITYEYLINLLPNWTAFAILWNYFVITCPQIVLLDRQRNQKVLLNQVYQQFSVYLGYILTIAGSQTLIGQYAIIREVSSVKYRLRGAFKKINQIKRNLWLDKGHIRLLEHKLGRNKKNNDFTLVLGGWSAFFTYSKSKKVSL